MQAGRFLFGMIEDMQELTDIYRSGRLHHAYVIEDGESARAELLRFIEEELGMPVRGNPDVHVRQYDSFGIDDSREIQRIESSRAVGGDKKIFVLSLNSMTREAQNALLKLFEEPTDGAHFFVLMSIVEALLPTLRSRVQIIRRKGSEPDLQFALQFLKSSPAERLALIADMIESKDKAQAIEFVSGLEAALYAGVKFNAGFVPIAAFEEIRDVRSYLGDRSSSVKILLEHLSVVLPIVT